MQRLKQDMNIGTNISRLCARAGLTQEQTIARMQVLGCTLSRSTYSQIEGGTYNIRVGELLAMKRYSKPLLMIFLRVYSFHQLKNKCR